MTPKEALPAVPERGTERKRVLHREDYQVEEDETMEDVLRQLDDSERLAILEISGARGSVRRD